MNIESQQDLRNHWDERYRSGQTPWDTGITPPEVQGFWEEQPKPASGALAFDIGLRNGAQYAIPGEARTMRNRVRSFRAGVAIGTAEIGSQQKPRKNQDRGQSHVRSGRCQ